MTTEDQDAKLPGCTNASQCSDTFFWCCFFFFLRVNISNATLSKSLKYTMVTKLSELFIGDSSLNLLAKPVLHSLKCFQLNSQEKEIDVFL